MPNGEVIRRLWRRNRPQNVDVVHGGNPYISSEYRSLSGGSTSATQFTYDQSGNLLQRTDFDFGVTPPSGIPSADPSGTPARTEARSFYIDAGAATESNGNDADAYWQGTTDHGQDCSQPPCDPPPGRLLSAAEFIEMREGGSTGTLKAKTVLVYDDEETTGNLTSETRGVGSTVETVRTYTSNGNLATVTDPEGT